MDSRNRTFLFSKLDLVLYGIFVLFSFLLHLDLFSWTIYIVTGLSLVGIFIFRAIKGVLLHISLSMILSYWFFSMVIGMSIIHSYAEMNEPLKFIALFMTIINLIFFGYYANRKDAMGWMAHLITMVAMSFWVAF